MKEIIITTQTELDALKDGFDAPTRIIIKNTSQRIVVKVQPRNCSIVGRENCSIVGWENCSIVGWENCSIEGWENCSIVGRENCSIVGRGNCSIEGRGNCSIEGWENCVVRIFSNYPKKVALYGFAVAIMASTLTVKIEKKSVHAHIQITKDLGWFERNAVKKTAKVVLYKRISKDFKTQENTANETTWTIGTTLTHPKWSPENEECGKGKFHACSRPYFCDEFRSNSGDRYIAISVSLKDLYEWKENPQYKYKIAVRKATVLYECDKHGKEINGKN